MAVIYLQPEDEITGAVARLRAMPSGDVVMVVPAGSRVATSRINFRLLARESRVRGLRLAIVSDEPGVRALSTAAGVASHANVDAAEAAFARDPAPVAAPVAAAPAGSSAAPAASAPATATAVSIAADAPPDDTKTQVLPAVVASRDGGPTGRPPRVGGRLSVEPPLYDMGDVSRRRRRSAARFVAPVIALVLLLTLVGLGLYGAYLFVPTAAVSLEPRLIDVGPASTTVTANPQVAVVDAAAGLIPATQLQLALMSTNTFPATGTEVTTTAATGAVRFSSKNTVFEVPVPAGTVVSTANGIEFETTSSVTVPRANFDSHQPGTAVSNVVARQAGDRGNVAANAIKKLPASLNSALVTVRNPEPTSGGARTESAVVSQADYDAAVAQLTAGLTPQLLVTLTDPNTTPHGLTIYPASAVIGPAVVDQEASAVVDTKADSFTLSVSANATVLAVNEEQVDQVAQTQLYALVPAGTTLLPATIKTTHAPGEVSGDSVVYNASAAAKSWRSPNQDELLAQISGQNVTDARAIMEKYGTPDISIWPDFIDRLPEQNRIRLTIVPPQETP
jgi:baseplate J-like protein